MAWWIDACRGQKSQWVNPVGKITYNETVVIFFVNLEEIYELAITSTRGLASGVRNGLLDPRSIRTLAGLKGLFHVFVLFLDLTCEKSVSYAIDVRKTPP